MVLVELTAADLGDDALLGLTRGGEPPRRASIYVDGASTAIDRRARLTSGTGSSNWSATLSRTNRSLSRHSARRSRGSRPWLSDVSPRAQPVAAARCSLRSAPASSRASPVTCVCPTASSSTRRLHPPAARAHRRGADPRGSCWRRPVRRTFSSGASGTCAGSGMSEPHPHSGAASGRDQSSRAPDGLSNHAQARVAGSPRAPSSPSRGRRH